jgi:hypothetical protein
MMTSRLLRVDDPAWTSFLAATRHDVYHLPAYVELSARQEGGEPRALYVERGTARLLLPLIVRPIDGASCDAASPYGYPGPLVSGTDEPRFLRDALLAGCHSLEGAGIVSLFVRMHPLLNPVLPQGVGTIVEHGCTVAVDLQQSPAALWNETRTDHRSHINRAVRAGDRARIDQSWEHFATFKQLYRDTMARRSAAAYYFFDDDYFDGLRARLGEHLWLAVVEIDERVVAASLLTEMSGIVQWHLSGSDPGWAKRSPTKLLIHFARGWARDRGNQWFHLGGGLGAANDSLLEFKAGFSRLRVPFATLRMVVLEQRYRELVTARDPAADASRRDGFFPAYRASRLERVAG